ncbi:MAG TPA: crosslink repair DNA glycosylase YcaQ family protein, partial [Kofleriaceae bacterium]
YAAPATTAQISTWSGRSQRDVKAALESLVAVSVSVEGMGEAWLLPADVDALRAAKPPKGVATLAFEDNYLVNHGLGAVADPRHHSIKIDIWGPSKPESIGEAEHVLSRTIVVDGLIAGYWEVDPKANGAVWTTFEPASKPVAKQIDEATNDTARFLLAELGHARAYSLDSMELVQERADKIKKRAARSRDGMLR